GDRCETEFWPPWRVSFRLTNQMQRELRDLLASLDLPSLKERYDDPKVHDGGWMQVSLRTNGKVKTVRWVNWYPRPLRDLVSFFAADVFPRYPQEFRAAVKISEDTIHKSRERVFLDDKK